MSALPNRAQLVERVCPGLHRKNGRYRESISAIEAPFRPKALHRGNTIGSEARGRMCAIEAFDRQWVQRAAQRPGHPYRLLPNLEVDRSTRYRRPGRADLRTPLRQVSLGGCLTVR